DHDRLLFAVSTLDPPPLPSERHALQELARAIGVDRLVHDLHGSEANRFGAARLLSAEGSTLALRSVAGMSEDPFEPLRSLAGRGFVDPRRFGWSGGSAGRAPFRSWSRCWKTPSARCAWRCWRCSPSRAIPLRRGSRSSS